MKITPKVAREIYIESLQQDMLSEDACAHIFYSQSMLQYRLDLLRTTFPHTTLHAIAIKTCSHEAVLAHIIAEGFGLEAASLEEVKLAIHAGANPDKIVFDSPVKTQKEITYCHEHLPGILLNANSIIELERYPINFSGKIGLRINPLTSSDSHPLLNVATTHSKFGVPISDYQAILTAAIKYPQISCLHIHIGSDVDNFDKNITAIQQLVILADNINIQRQKLFISSKIDTLDIGGGIKFDESTEGLSIQTFVDQLVNIPSITNYRLITEYGAFVHQYNSFVVSDIEYVLPNKNGLPTQAYIHIGADLFLRKVYSSLPIKYPCSVWQQEPNENREKYTIVGPLCFAGDILYPEIELPRLKAGDQLVIYNIGANTWSMWSKHCSRIPPPFLFIAK